MSEEEIKYELNKVCEGESWDFLIKYISNLQGILNELESWLEFQIKHTSQQNNYWRVLDKLKELIAEKMTFIGKENNNEQ